MKHRFRLPVLSRRRNRQGFSLIEIMVVLGVLGIVAAFSLPSISSLVLGSSLNRAGQSVAGELTLARQEAMTKNCETEVRFYRVSALWTALQVWKVEAGDSGTTYSPLRPPLFLPSGIIMSETLSPLISSDSQVNGKATLPPRLLVSYLGFRFRPSGATGTAVTDTNNYVTLQEARAQGSPPANYCTLQVSPLSGNVSIYRP